MSGPASNLWAEPTGTRAAVNIRRVLTYSALVVLLPALVGFLSPLSIFLHGQRVTPSWVHDVRAALCWIVVTLLYARLALVQRDKLLLHAAIVVFVGWLFNGVLDFLILRLLNSLPGVPETSPSLVFRTAPGAFLIAAIRAVLGTVMGLAFVGLRKRSTRPVA